MSEITLRYEPREDGNVVVVETGEIISYEKYLEIRSIEKETQKAVDRKIKELNCDLGDQQQKKKYDNWLPNHHFIKAIVGNYVKWGEEMDVYERGIIHLMMGLVEWETNRVVVNGKDITNKYIQQKLNMGNDTFVRSINSLEEKNIIKRVGKSRSRKIYLNPLYVYQGKSMSYETLKKFEII